MITRESFATPVGDPVVPFRHWWGLLGCAALMGLIFLLAPYSADIEFAPDHGDWWHD
jgi:hypothetical protein